ncbi:MAG: cellulase family glycosylhydrolase [Sandaracinaceae bacterium]|nr:cellulase family glycosylhydrolase [Sandaracinaceae bacterium]
MAHRKALIVLVSIESIFLNVLGAWACGSSSPKGDAGSDGWEERDAFFLDSREEEDAGPRPPFEVPDCTQPPLSGFSPLRPRCNMLVDEEGRVVLLRGVNARVLGLFDVTFDDGRLPLQEIPDFREEDARRMRELGLNFLRLPINWSGLEPRDTTPRTFVQSYIDRLKEILDLCRAHGIYVLVDWHQDAYSKEIGEDGAPLWAIHPPPEMLLGGPLTDLEARRVSRQVLRAFATFFGDDEPGPTLRQRFAEAVVHVVQALRGDEIVVGFEVYNEPVASDAQTRRLNEFVARAIRAADPTRLVFFEPPAIPRNFTDQAALASRPFEVQGAVYAPHSYTLAFRGSEEERRSFTKETLRRSHENAQREAASWGTPLLIGEWGYDPRGIRAEDYYRMQVELMDEYAESWALWLWKEQSQGRWGVHDYDDATGRWRERPLVVRAITRPRPERIAGWPRRFGWNASEKSLEIRFRGEASIRAPTTIYLPERALPGYRVFCDGREIIPSPSRDPRTGLIAVECNGDGEHVIRVEGIEGVD